MQKRIKRKVVVVHQCGYAKIFFQNLDGDYAPRYANINSNIDLFYIRPNSRDIAITWLKKVRKPPILISKNYCAPLRRRQLIAQAK